MSWIVVRAWAVAERLELLMIPLVAVLHCMQSFISVDGTEKISRLLCTHVVLSRRLSKLVDSALRADNVDAGQMGITPP